MIKVFHIAREVAANVAMGIGTVRNRRVQRGRTSPETLSKQVQVILEQFHFFMDNIGWNNVRNKVIAEIGPGDAIPHGLLFLGAGARQYIAIDRFLGNVSDTSSQELYAALIKSAPERIQRGWTELGLLPYQYPWLEPAQRVTKVKLVPCSVEEIIPNEIERADIIISFNVVEHLSNIAKGFAKMAGVLNLGGLMLHRVDYGPHGLWKSYRNPLSFLAVPKVLWSLMGSNRGYPNRVRHSRILSVLDSYGLHSTARITARFSTEDVEAIKPYLAKELRQLTDEDLVVRNAEILSSKSSHLLFREKNLRHSFQVIQ